MPGGGKERKDVGDEVEFSFGQPVPICEVCREVDLFRSVGMVYGEDYNVMWILLH